MRPSTSPYLYACSEAWAQCETLMAQLAQKTFSYSRRTLQVLDECTTICLGTMQAIEDRLNGIANMALLCVGICEECAELCERYPDGDFLTCAAACRQCSTLLSQLAAEAA